MKTPGVEQVHIRSVRPVENIKGDCAPSLEIFQVKLGRALCFLI